MKTVKTIFASLVLIVLVSASTIAQSGAKVIAVVNQAEWCTVCKTNCQRATATFMGDNKDMAVKFITNDLTNDATKKKSSEELKKYGLNNVMADYKGTGVAYFFNSETKALINQISLAGSDQELTAALVTAKNGLK